MSILETITSLNQEASAARASTETANAKTSERVSKKLPSQPSTDTTTEREKTSEDVADKEKSPPDSAGEGQEAALKSEELSDLPCPVEEIKNHTKESNSSLLLNKDVQQESSDQKNKSTDKGEKKPDSNEKGERKKEKKEKPEKKFDHSKRSEDIQKVKEEKQAKDKEVECSKLPSEKNSNKAKEGTKEGKKLQKYTKGLENRLSVGGSIRFAFKILINFILLFQKPENISPFCYKKEPQTFVFLFCAGVTSSQSK